MRRWLKVTLAIVLLVAAAAAVFLVPTLWFKPWSIDHFYARVFLVFALERPMLLSQLRILEPLGLDFHSNDLDDFSVEFALREARRVDGELAILRRYDRSSMSEEQRLSAEVLEWFMANASEGSRWIFHDYPVNQFGGLQSWLPDFMINTHQINRLKDARNYVARVLKFGGAVDQIIEQIEERERRGIVPPRFVLEKVLEQIRGFTDGPARENALYTHFAEAIGGVEGVGPSEAERLRERLESAIDAVVDPAYGRLARRLEQQRTIATTDDGVWKLPDGKAYYAWRLGTFTTTEMTAGEIHALGLREVERIGGEMRAILEAQGHGAEGISEALGRLNRDERFLYPDTEEGRRRILADYQSLIDEVEARLDGLFGVRPRAGVKVEPVPEFRQATSAMAYYQPPPLDGSRPGTFFVNLREVGDIARFRMRTLAYHEAIPGHHFQIAVAQELTGLPFFRRVIPFTAYTEGWALYAERLAAEHGFLDDPFDRLGHLSDQMLRAVRLVVDTGIHAERWSREEAIDYMRERTGMPEREVVAEIERYIVNPGQACAYMVGMLKILELRARAMERLGGRFDVREFHDAVLSNGALPLGLLERIVEQWIASRGGAEPEAAGTDSQPRRPARRLASIQP